MGKCLIIKIISKIKIHPLFYVVAFIVSITGFFKDFSYIMFIIVIHELGHILASLYFNWNIEKIVILPFGGLTIFNEKINKPIIEEMLIAIAGPLVQILFFSFFKDPLIMQYNLFLLTFNLLPIIPLDGSKILNCFMNYIFPFKRAHLITILISLVIAFGGLFYKFNLVLILIFLFLFKRIIWEYKGHQSIFNKFLFERYVYGLKFKKYKKINGKNFNKMFKDYNHLFYVDNKWQSEYEMLKKRFDI